MCIDCGDICWTTGKWQTQNVCWWGSDWSTNMPKIVYNAAVSQGWEVYILSEKETKRLYSRISLVILPGEPLGPVYTHADISLLIRNLCFGYLKKKDLRSINLWKLSSGMSQEELASWGRTADHITDVPRFLWYHLETFLTVEHKNLLFIWCTSSCGCCSRSSRGTPALPHCTV